MKSFNIFFVPAVLVVVALVVAGYANLAGAENLKTPPGLAIAASHIPVCPPGNPQGTVRCHARVVVDSNGKPQTTIAPAAYGPLQFRTAYNLTGTGNNSQIIAIVDAYDAPNIKSDLDYYSNYYGLPVLPNCNGPIAFSGVPCFQKVNQNGETSNYPAVNNGWALEVSLDVEVAHAICPNCSILLVEANSSNLTDMFSAVDRAAALGATEISNSYGTTQEFSTETLYDPHFNLPGVAVTVSSGDSGYGTSYPAVSPYVTAVGGTSLYLNSDNTYKSEAAWSGSGSGCSTREVSKPAGQPTVSGCTRRMIADVSAVADPNTGAAVYDTTSYNGQSGWFKVGGTSLSSPLIAGVYALSGGVSTGIQGNSLPYASSIANFHDITSGKTGNCNRRTPALCTARIGFDGPTGLGTPNGIGGF